MKIDKNLVKKNFSKGAKTYDDYAHIQKYMADKLAGLIESECDEKSILEIGCGTGYLSRRILEHFPNSNIDLLDISENMLDKTKENLGDFSNINYILADVETYKFNKKYDLIVSNAVLQWIENPDELFKKLKKMLSENGKIMFATFGKDTYKELTNSFNEIDPNCQYSQNFLSLEDFVEICEKGYSVLYTKEEYKLEEYSNVLEFLRGIKKIGANCALPNKRKLSKDKVKLLESTYRKNYSVGNGIYATNHILYMMLQKKSSYLSLGGL